MRTDDRDYLFHLVDYLYYAGGPAVDEVIADAREAWVKAGYEVPEGWNEE